MSAGVGQGQEQDVLTAARFQLMVDKHEMASFSELAGINSAVDVVDYMSSDGKFDLLKKLPGKRVPPTITLKRGMTKNIELYAWHELVVLGDVPAARRSAELVLLNTKNDAVAKFLMFDCWPNKMEIGALKAGASEVLVETVTFVCEHIQRVSV